MRPAADVSDAPEALRRLRRLRRKAWRALAWERAAPLLWPPVAVAAAFLAAAWSGLLPLLPGWPHAAVLAGFAVGLAAALWRAVRRWRRPLPLEVERRIETDSGARHRPLAALRDQVGGDESGPGRALWAAHRRRLADGVAGLTVGGARPDVAAADPWGLRHLALLLLVVAFVGARGAWEARLTAALTPSFAPLPAIGGGNVAVEAWLAPPEAAGLAPIFLPINGERRGGAASLAVPAGSRLTARVAGGAGAPTLLANGAEQNFIAVDGRNFQIEATIRSGDLIAVERRGASLAEWPVTVVPDRPPEIDFIAPPAAGERGTLRVDYVAADDYGLARARLRVAPADDAETTAAVEELPLNLPAARPRQARGGGVYDLTGHLWAGLPAVLSLIVEDAGGQAGESEPVTMILPERRFAHPVARLLAAERRRLTLEGERARPSAAATLRDVAAQPEAFRGDVTAFLAISIAAGRLTRDYGPRSVGEAQALMWEAALRIEDGGASQAERALRQAQQALADALERGAADAELQALMDRLQNAMDGWLDALEQQMRRALENGETPPQLPPELAERLTDRGELQSMLDRMRNMAQTGARDAARQMLSQLQQMMERMQTAAPDQGGGEERNRAFDLMRRLRELADKQQTLLDETFRQSNRGAQAGEGEEGGAAARRRSARDRAETRRGRPSPSPLMQRQAERQNELRRGLGEAMRELGELTGEIPRPLGRAEREMREAETALRGGAPEAAVDPQSEAVEALRQGLQSFAEQVMQQMTGAMAGAGQGRPGGASGRGRDPLGRMQPQGTGGMDSTSVKVPTEVELQRARDILQELRRRAGEPARPILEREYIDRLLRRF